MSKTLEESTPKYKKLEVERWLEETVAIKDKKEFLREENKSFDKPIIVLTEEKKPLGVVIKFNEESLEKLPGEVRIFLSDVLNAAGCKLLKQAIS